MKAADWIIGLSLAALTAAAVVAWKRRDTTPRDTAGNRYQSRDIRDLFAGQDAIFQ